MKKTLKIILPIILLAAVFGSVIYASSASKWNIRRADGTKESKGIIYLEKNETTTFRLFKGENEIAPGNSEYDVTWASSDATVLYVDAATGFAHADKDGAMTSQTGEVSLLATITEKSSGAVTSKSITVIVSPGRFELISTISGINDGLSLEANVEYTIISRTYDRVGDELSLSTTQLYCSHYCDGLDIQNGKFTATERGTYRIITTGYATEEDQAAGTNAVIVDVLEIYVYAEPTPTPEPTPEPTAEPEA